MLKDDIDETKYPDQFILEGSVAKNEERETEINEKAKRKREREDTGLVFQ